MSKIDKQDSFTEAEPISAQKTERETAAEAPEAKVAEKTADVSVEDEAERDAETGGEGAGQTESPSRRRRMRHLLFALLPLALVVGGYFYVTGGAVMDSDNAYVRADTVSVSTDVSGIVESVAVHDNEQVKKGQVLFRLDPLPFQLALEKANGQLGIAKAQLAAQKGAYAQIQTELKQAELDVAFYERDFERKKTLQAQDFASRAQFDESQHNLQDAEQNLASLKTQLAQAAAKLDGHPDYPVEKLSGYKYALAERDEAARQLRHATVRAPFDGVVTNVPKLQVGQSLGAGAAAFSLVATHHVWVESNPKETQLTWVKPGQPVSVTVDTYPGVTWHGTVDSISPASASSFSILPAQNTSGNWVKVVQRIPLRVKIETPDDLPTLRAGMSAEIAVDTGHVRGLPTFLTDWFGGATAHAKSGKASSGKASHG
ncbi:HlyD family secretion protein [Methyloligella sp. 2.7D]|uniref:HlyD family secretion protein n=1 Tax=unclassified Methyloligella TaxID=2625955 RepID=UPI00157CC39E|nr:HlyD family secretion protein [Methyloligella sp. GL2]QKP76335.1 HlyD family secretion protein [Methyloligella sp. GL2]